MTAFDAPSSSFKDNDVENCNAVSPANNFEDPEEYTSSPFMKQGSRFLLSGTLGGVRTSPMWDTGSTAAFVHPKMVPSLQQKGVKFHRTSIKVKLADSKTVEITQWADIPLNVGPITVVCRFYVFHNLAHSVILGTAAMSTMKLIIDMDEGSVYVMRGPRKIYLPYQHLSCKDKSRQEANLICFALNNEDSTASEPKTMDIPKKILQRAVTNVSEEHPLVDLSLTDFQPSDVESEIDLGDWRFSNRDEFGSLEDVSASVRPRAENPKESFSTKATQGSVSTAHYKEDILNLFDPLCSASASNKTQKEEDCALCQLNFTDMPRNAFLLPSQLVSTHSRSTKPKRKSKRSIRFVVPSFNGKRKKLKRTPVRISDDSDDSDGPDGTVQLPASLMTLVPKDPTTARNKMLDNLAHGKPQTTEAQIRQSLQITSLALVDDERLRQASVNNPLTSSLPDQDKIETAKLRAKSHSLAIRANKVAEQIKDDPERIAALLASRPKNPRYVIAVCKSLKRLHGIDPKLLVSTIKNSGVSPEESIALSQGLTTGVNILAALPDPEVDIESNAQVAHPISAKVQRDILSCSVTAGIAGSLLLESACVICALGLHSFPNQDVNNGLYKSAQQQLAQNNYVSWLKSLDHKGIFDLSIACHFHECVSSPG